MDGPPRCIVEFVSLAVMDWAGFKPLRTPKVHGTLGLMTINTDIFICVISGATRVAAVRPGENVQRISSVDFCQYLMAMSPGDKTDLSETLSTERTLIRTYRMEIFRTFMTMILATAPSIGLLQTIVNQSNTPALPLKSY